MIGMPNRKSNNLNVGESNIVPSAGVVSVE
jgi:hypothetical protein